MRFLTAKVSIWVFKNIYLATPKGSTVGGEKQIAFETINSVFEKIKNNTSINEFKDGLSSYLASSYYKYRTKKKGHNEEEEDKLQKKLKLAMRMLENNEAL